MDDDKDGEDACVRCTEDRVDTCTDYRTTPLVREEEVVDGDHPGAVEEDSNRRLLREGVGNAERASRDDKGVDAATRLPCCTDRSMSPEEVLVRVLPPYSASFVLAAARPQ